MLRQNQVKQCLAQPESVEYIGQLLGSEESVGRCALAEFLCEQFGFFNAHGEVQLSSCLKALRELEAKGRIHLPGARSRGGQSHHGSPRRLSQPVAFPEGLPEKVGEIQDLKLTRVTTDAEMRIWNELMMEGHPRGAGPLVGRQIRYLISSGHGWLGGLGFSAAALQLADREEWIGWSSDQRREQLHRVVCLNRFLIRPGIECRNLASRVLSLSVGALPGDFQQRYKFEPWLIESFVDKSSWVGTCYQAANWRRIGQTRGRGRQERSHRANESIKDIYVYSLSQDFRIRMGLSPEAGLGPLEPTQGLEGKQWAEKEFGKAPLGDKRLSQRLVMSAGMKAQKPDRAFNHVADGDSGQVKGYYRLIDKPDDSAVTMENILAPHRQRTIRRMESQQTVLCIQDGSDIDYNNLEQCEGLGTIGTNQTGAQSRGLHLHPTLAVAPSGLVLGVLRAEALAPEPKSAEDRRPTHSIPIEEKETFNWVKGLRDTMEVAGQMPQTRLISVCDRGADFLELFQEHRNNPCVELLVRAHHNRNIASSQDTEQESKLFEAVRKSPLKTTVTISVPRQSARPKKSKQKARKKRDARTAELSIRYLSTEIVPPKYYKDKEPIPVSVIHAVEEDPPEGDEAVEWFLITTLGIDSPEKALECLGWYCQRWRIEEFFRVLKSGCSTEELTYKTAQRLRRGIAINLVIAWRIMLMTHLGREVPELPMEVLFSDLEIKVLRAYSKKKETSHLPKR